VGLQAETIQGGVWQWHQQHRRMRMLHWLEGYIEKLMKKAQEQLEWGQDEGVPTSQHQDAALALRLQREEFIQTFRESSQEQTIRLPSSSFARENLRAMASRAMNPRTRDRRRWSSSGEGAEKYFEPCEFFFHRTLLTMKHMLCIAFGFQNELWKLNSVN